VPADVVEAGFAPILENIDADGGELDVQEA
jgi:hypothetical protein